MRRKLLALLSTAVLTAALAIASPSAALAQEPLPTEARPLPAELSASDLADELDVSLRWLRAQWDPKGGAYGDVRTTARVLAALAHSPRKYRHGDGPFVGRAVDALLAKQGADGLFRDEGADDATARRDAPAVREALLAFQGMPAVDAALERLAAAGFAAPAEGAPRTGDAAAARELALALLAKRAPDGSFGGSELDTAGAVLALSGAHADIAAAEPRPAKRPAQPLPPFTAADDAKVVATLARGAAYLAAHPAGAPGRFGVGEQADPGVTAMAITALLAVPAPRSPEAQQHVEAGLAWLRSLAKPDGSIHDGRLANYATSAAVMAFARAGDERDRELLAGARAFLERLQADEGEGYDESHRYYGGIGYGGDERPDLSNLQMALEALHATGASSEDAALRKALVFLQRTQNRSESNDLVVIDAGKTTRAGDDGGGVYAPGESKAGAVQLPDGTSVPRSYGSMTYALLRGYLFAGLAKDDPRVQAAWNWLREHYTLDVNPGFEASSDPLAPYQGLFYYFYSMAKALDAFGEEVVVDPGGAPHPWRRELAGRIAAMQRADGSWINENSPRWWEGNPVLATAYAMLVLDATRPDAAPAASGPSEAGAPVAPTPPAPPAGG